VLVDSGAPLGAALGGIIIAWLILSLGSWRTASGILTMLLGALAWWYLRDDPRDHSGVNAGELATIKATKSASPSVQVAGSHSITKGSFAAILARRMSWAMVNFGLLTWGPSYLAQARGLDLKQMGGATFVIFLAGMVGSLTSGSLVDWLQERGYDRGAVYKWALGLSGLGVMLSFLALPQIADPIAAVLLLSATLFLPYFGSLYWSLPAILAPKKKFGVVGGAMNFAGTASGIAIPIIVGRGRSTRRATRPRSRSATVSRMPSSPRPGSIAATHNR
jgi:ACS family D-galactonate transporter-like MFS transporter